MLFRKKKEKSGKKDEYIKAVADGSGWSEEEAGKALDSAKERGLSNAQYVKNECWTMGEDQLSAFIEKKNELRKKREENIAKVAEASGWTKEKAAEEMKKASAMGITYGQYAKEGCWEMDEAQLSALAEKKRELKAKKEGYLDDITADTGWTRAEAEEKMNAAKAMGIPFYKYANNLMYQLTEDELREYIPLMEAEKKRKDEDYAFYRDIVCRRAGWDEAKADEEIEKAAAEGVSVLKYVQNGLWEERDDRARVIKEINDDKKRLSKNKDTYTDRICEKTGWTRGKAKLEVTKARMNCGASYEDYLVYRFYEKTPEEQRKYSTLGMFNKMRTKYNNHYVSMENFDNKINFNRNFAEFINRRWFSNMDMSYEQFRENIEGLDRVIVKPLAATQGIGIEAFYCNVSEEEDRKLYDHLCELPESIVEEFIIQNDEVSEFCRTAVNTVRVMTLDDEGECRILYAVLRIGNDGIVDNFHAGGVAAEVDVNTGIVTSNGADLEGRVYTHSTATGKQIKGFQIPHWDKIQELCAKLCVRFPETKLVGWDFAVTQDGIDLVEGNPGASYIVAQIPNVEEGIGLADQMATPYI